MFNINPPDTNVSLHIHMKIDEAIFAAFTAQRSNDTKVKRSSPKKWGEEKWKPFFVDVVWVCFF